MNTETRLQGTIDRQLSDLSLIQIEKTISIPVYHIGTPASSKDGDHDESRLKLHGPDPHDDNSHGDGNKHDDGRNNKPSDFSRDTEKGDGVVDGASDWRMDYEVFQWIFIILFTLIAVVDRYTTNYWPLWVDSPGPTIPGNVGVTIFSVVSWVSSRMLLVSSSYIFLFQNHVFWNWFVENAAVNKWLRIRDIRQSNTRLHYHVGWLFIGVPVMLHVWTILLAAAFPQNAIKLYHSWMRPSEPDGNSIPFYADNLLSLGINDVYRLCSTTITFCVLIPYSVLKCCRNHNWSLAQWVHIIGATIYTVDLLRMYSHPHCWVFNVPFVFWWICDRIYGVFWYRRSVAVLVQKVQLDEEYVVCYLRVPDAMFALRGVGDICYFNVLDCGWDRAHPFTTFFNHGLRHKVIGSDHQLQPNWRGHKFSIYNPSKIPGAGLARDRSDDVDESEYVMSRQSTNTVGNLPHHHHGQSLVLPSPNNGHPRKGSKSGLSFSAGDFEGISMNVIKEQRRHESKSEGKDIDDGDGGNESDWNLGIIMQVIPDHTDCYQRKTWTSDIQRLDSCNFAGLRTWGPYRSEYRILQRSEGQRVYPSTPIVLIGTGAGCSFLLDFYFYAVGNDIALQRAVTIYFSTRSIAMFQWFTDITCHREHDNLYVHAHLTSNDNITYHQKPSNENRRKSRDSKIGRMNLEEILDAASSDTHVFYCGSPSIQNTVRRLCQDRNLMYHAGHSFN